MFVHEDRRISGAQTLALRLREGRERLVYQHHGGYALFPRFKCVAHGGAGARPSSTDPDHQAVNRLGDLFELCLVQGTPRIGLVGALDP